METEVKIDKRTREYRELVEREAREAALEGCEPRTDLYICEECGGTGKGEGCMEQGGFVAGLCPECCGHKMWFRGERTKIVAEVKTEEKQIGVYVKDQFARREDNPGFKLCMHCGADLPPNEDGTPRWRKWPEACDECIRRNL